MSLQLFSQRDPAWAGKILLGGPDTIGAAGCLLVVNAMINWDAFADAHYNPAELDDLFTSRHDYVSGDLITDGALANIWPDRYSWQRVNGWDNVQFDAAIRSSDTYVIVGLAGPGTHFVLGEAVSGYIADPWTGKIGTLGGYLSTGWHVTDMVFVTRHPVAPAPSPTPNPPTVLPQPTPVPIPMWYVEDDADVVVVPPQTTLEAAKTAADNLAKAQPGKTFVVEDDKDVEVYSAHATVYTVRGGGKDILVVPDLDTAKAEADKDAAANPGTVYEVDDDQNKVAYSALVPAPTPPPVIVLTFRQEVRAFFVALWEFVKKYFSTN